MDVHSILLFVISAFTSASITAIILYKRGKLFIPHPKNIWEKDIDNINKFINKNMEYLNMYFSYDVLTFGTNKDCAYIINTDNRLYIKFKYVPFGLFSRSMDRNIYLETAYERIIQKHFTDMNTFLVVDEETECLLNMFT